MKTPRHRAPQGVVFLGSLLALAWAGSASGAEPAGGVEGTVIRLPPMLVTAANSGPAWQYLSVPGYEIISRANRTTTRAFVEGVIRADQLLTLLVPEDLQGTMSSPHRIVLTTPELAVPLAQEFLQRRSALQAPLPGGPQAGNPATGPRAAQAVSQTTIGIVRAGGGQRPSVVTSSPNSQLAGGQGGASDRVIVLPGGVRLMPMANVKLDDLDSTATYVEAEPSVMNSDRIQLDLANVEDRLFRRTPALPPWFVSGVLSLYDGAFRSGTTEFTLVPLIWESAPATKALRENPDHPRVLWSMAEFLRMPAPPVGHPDNQAWQAHATLFVRWALDPRNTSKEAFWEFVRQLATGRLADPETGLREIMGLSSADLRDRLSDYLPVAAANSLVLKPAQVFRINLPLPRDATPLELARVRGEVERLEVLFVQGRQPEYADRYAGQVRRSLEEGSAEGGNDPVYQGIRGLFAVDIGDDFQARDSLEAAVRGKVPRPRVYLELARLRFIDAQQAGAGLPLGAAQTDAIFTLLQQADALHPPVLRVYQLAADVARASDLATSAQAIPLLESGLRAFPRDPSLLHSTAALLIRHRRMAEATTLVERGLQVADSDEVRGRLEALQRVVAPRRN